MAGIDGISAVRLHTLAMAEWGLLTMKQRGVHWDKKYEVTMLSERLKDSIKLEMKWWVLDYSKSDPCNMHWNGKLHTTKPPALTVYTDTCGYKWGLWVPPKVENGLGEIRQRRPFQGHQLNWHITLQETYAAV